MRAAFAGLFVLGICAAVIVTSIESQPKSLKEQAKDVCLEEANRYRTSKKKLDAESITLGQPQGDIYRAKLVVTGQNALGIERRTVFECDAYANEEHTKITFALPTN